LSSASLIAGNTSRPAPVRILQRAFSFPVVLAGFLAVLAVFTVRGRFDDPDMWWHLKTGEVIWTTHTIPTKDLFSYTTNHQSSVPQEWLSEALIYGAYRSGGYSGLMLWLCFSSSVLLIAGYVLCSSCSGNSKIGFLGAMIVWFFATVGLSVRPQVIGYILLVFELVLLHLGRTRSPRWLFGLPILFVLWVNCHASFFLGLVVLALFLFCSFFDFEVRAVASEGWDAGRRRILLLATVLSAAAVFVNPLGLKQVLYPLDTMLHQPMNLSNVQEWKPLALSDPRGAGLLGVLVLVAVCLIAQRSARLFLYELVLLAMGAWLAFSHQRMAIVFGILSAPVVSRLLSSFWSGYKQEEDRPVLNTVVLILTAVAVYLAFPSRQSLAKQVDAGSPVRAVEYIKTHHLSGNMLNAYDYGGYLIWALPDRPDFIDGRADLFEWAGVLREFGQWAMLQSDPNALLDKYDVSFCLLERGDPVVRAFPQMRNWKEVYSDNASVIFVRSNAATASQ
jgi:hypothetical protein